MTVDLLYPHITKLPGEPARLERHPRLRVAQIVMDHLAHGWSAEEIVRQHPALALAEAHAALGYYFDHQATVDAEIAMELETAEKSAQASPIPFALRLRQLRQR
ncbi:MAG: DUF433 domain-containing protein [Verrucomicrobiota bacterium]